MVICAWCKKQTTETWGGLCSICWDADEVRMSEQAQDWLEDRL